MSQLADKIKHLPNKPGVYKFINEAGRVIYVGKAKHLIDRVSSYLLTDQLEPKVKAMMSHAVDIDFIVTESAHEALILENVLIKELMPHYNILLKDDKEYSFLAITKEMFPKLTRVRRILDNNAHYFGPYTKGGSVTANIRTLRQFFPIRTCNLKLPEEKSRPCLDFHIGICSAPCSGQVSQEDYNSTVSDILLLLSGKYKRLEEALTKKMHDASTALRFEDAARYRECIRHLSAIVSKQRVVSPNPVDRDIFAVHSDKGEACVEFLKVRGGRLILDMHMFAGSDELSSNAEFLGAVMQNIYGTHQNVDLPTEIIVSVKPGNEKELTEFINEGRQLREPIKIIQPKKGDKIELVNMALTNAKHHLSEHMRREQIALGQNAITQLQESLKLKKLPVVIEGYDIANIQGKAAVGAQVVFKDGKPYKKGYRIYKIRSKDTPDDYAMMRETLERRREHWDDEEFALKPDLLLIDGGVGQLNVAIEVFSGVDIEIAGLAKEEELVIREGEEPIRLSRDSLALRLLQQVRDEAHRFGGKHFRIQHKKQSGLDKKK
jgi:excinuclease ABC subunit C